MRPIQEVHGIHSPGLKSGAPSKPGREARKSGLLVSQRVSGVLDGARSRGLRDPLLPVPRALARGMVTLILGLAALSCGGREGPPVGISPPRATERGPGGPDAAAGPPWIAPDDFRARLSPISERFLSRGHAERFDAIIWADKPSGTADAGSAFAEGAMFVEETIARGVADGGGSGLLMMEKRSGTWRFAAVSTEGDITSDSRVAPCAECHKEAPRDFVFRVPKGEAQLPGRP